MGGPGSRARLPAARDLLILPTVLPSDAAATSPDVMSQVAVCVQLGRRAPIWPV